MEGNRLRLSWRGILAVIGATIVIGSTFLYFGKFELARPTLFSIAAVGIAAAIKWHLRKRVWFWASILTIAALHFPLILWVQWTNEWIPAFVMTPILIADVAVILGIIKILEKLFGHITTRAARTGSLS